jgi:ABC-type polysaccharide/polyol phosphate transport system ATPase subunit
MTRVFLENVRVDFPIYGAPQRSLRTTIFQRATGGLIHRDGRHKERVVVRALSDLSLRLEEGDRLGLIGHNGSGKSTLLKVIAGIYEPTIGTRAVQGRVTPLFDMMPGLDPEDNGYENILTAGMLLGMSRDQVESKIPEVEEFCELGEYLSLPVRTYSAGMITRLGFALVTALEPGVLLIDEGFGTGDLRFTERATERMDEFMGRSRIIVLASHSESKIKSICNKAALMQEGRLVAVGPVADIYDRYKAMVHADAAQAAVTAAPAALVAAPERPVYVQADAAQAAVTAAPAAMVAALERPVYCEDSIRDIGLVDRLRRNTGAVRFIRAIARDESGKSRWTYEPGETVTFRFDYEVLESVPSLALSFLLYRGANPFGEHVVTEIREVVSAEALDAGQTGAVELALPRLSLMPNRFLLYVRLGSATDRRSGYDVIDANIDLPALTIASETKDRKFEGVVFVEHELRRIEMARPVAALVT